MNNIFNVVLLLLVSVLIIIPGASANSGYFSDLQSVYGTTGTSCSTCHTSPPALNSYGNAFAAITTHSSDPKGALNSIGVPPGVPAPPDTIPPETAISGVIESGLYNNNVTITLIGTDNTGGSGVKEAIFSVNGGPATIYATPFVVDMIGQDNVSYWSTDNAGNIELPKIVNFTIISESVIDTIPPETAISGVTQSGLYNGSVTITLNAADNPEGSGVKETVFSVNGGQTATYTAPFVVDTIGQDSVTYWSTDNAGNIEFQKMVNFIITSESLIDTIPPETIISGVTENGLYSNNVAIALIATDNPEGSGVKETMFNVNGGQTATYTVPFIVDIIGKDSVTYWSTDTAGNIEPQKMVNFTITSESIDTVPPITNIWGVIENGSYNNNVTISLTATDNPGGSGVNETIFSVNGGQTATYTEPFVVDRIGRDNVTYWSIDTAGNIELPKMVNFTFEPSINATREIERKSILPGESTNIIVRITSNANQALTLHENIPEGWNVTATSNDMNGFKNSTHEWVLFNLIPGVPKTITYTLTSPGTISIGTYQINGTIRNDGMVENVSGNESVKIDILEFYRRLGSDPAIIETGDLMEAINDSRNSITPSGFDRPLNAEEIGELVNEWVNT
ncbi:MAG TPA: hypothetical protein VKL21_03310 [Candidatus Methanoperedens sp.]|nr:hypothetical protein [Candidatus Methanoperedens sp.]